MSSGSRQHAGHSQVQYMKGSLPIPAGSAFVSRIQRLTPTPPESPLDAGATPARAPVARVRQSGRQASMNSMAGVL